MGGWEGGYSLVLMGAVSGREGGLGLSFLFESVEGLETLTLAFSVPSCCTFSKSRDILFHCMAN